MKMLFITSQCDTDDLKKSLFGKNIFYIWYKFTKQIITPGFKKECSQFSKSMLVLSLAEASRKPRFP